MSNPFVGEIRIFAGNFAPAGWANCDGALLPISENETLFQLIGTTYGGDGEESFALPDLRGRVPMHVGGLHQLAESLGTEQVVVTAAQMPRHSHNLVVSTNQADTQLPSGKVMAAAEVDLYRADVPNVTLGNPVASAGGGLAHENMMPFLAIRFIISLFGVFPFPS